MRNLFFLEKKPKGFWSDIKRIRGTCKPIAEVIDGKNTKKDITCGFKKKCETYLIHCRMINVRWTLYYVMLIMLYAVEM